MWRVRENYSYPLTNLLDNDPKTAWIFRGTTKRYGAGPFWQKRYGIIVKFPKVMPIDGIRLMNGYNKDPETFRRNNRAIEIQVGTYFERAFAKFQLPDKMGWHTIRFKARKLGDIAVYLTKFARGRDNDVCISGLEILSNGKTLRMHPGAALVFSPGDECG